MPKIVEIGSGVLNTWAVKRSGLGFWATLHMRLVIEDLRLKFC